MDLTLSTTVVGIVVEVCVAIYKLRRGDVEGHRKHVMTAVLFTAGPGLYRVNVEWLTWALDLRGADASTIRRSSSAHFKTLRAASRSSRTSAPSEPRSSGSLNMNSL